MASSCCEERNQERQKQGKETVVKKSTPLLDEYESCAEVDIEIQYNIHRYRNASTIGRKRRYANELKDLAKYVEKCDLEPIKLYRERR